jgi:hypothetical protein
MDMPLAFFQPFDPRNFYVEYGFATLQAIGIPSMMVFKFLDGVTGAVDGAVWTVDVESFPSMNIQSSITTSASFQVQGRIPGIEKWANLTDDPTTDETPFNVLTLPEMRVVSSAAAGALQVYGVAARRTVRV